MDGVNVVPCSYCAEPVELVMGLTMFGRSEGLVVLEPADGFSGDWLLEFPLFEGGPLIAQQLGSSGGNRRVHPCSPYPSQHSRRARAS